MRTCRMCGEEKPESAFYAHPKYRCKDCHRAKQREWYNANRERSIAAAAQWQQDNRERRNARLRVWSKENRERIRAYHREWSAAHPRPPRAPNEHSRASGRVRNRVRRGRMERPDACEICGAQSDRIEGHHPDYSQPLLVVWVCPTCHGAIHSQTTVNATR